MSKHNYFITLLNMQMKMKGVKQESLAKDINYSRSAINKFLNCKTDLRSDQLLQILEILDIDLTSIIEEKIKANTGLKSNNSISKSITSILDSLNPIAKKTLISNIIDFAKFNKDLKQETKDLVSFRNSISTTYKGELNVRNKSS